MAKAKPVKIGGMSFDRKGDALSFMKNMLNKYSPEEKVDEIDSKFLSSAILRHPEADDKIGVGIKHFFVRRADYGTKCFWLERIDGTVERFSYKYCIDG
tara:strand:+ start:1882 stop:2178 length:297 start_codon:yes stop_codon:yes gene_type:complete